MREIAAAADLSLAGLYHYVKGKDELLFLAIDSSLDSLLENLDAALGEAVNPEDKLLVLSETHLEFALQSGSALKVVIRDLENLEEPHRTATATKRQSYVERSLEVLRAVDPHDRSDQDLLAATNLLLAMLNAVVTKPFTALSGETRDLARVVTELFMYGFLGQEPGGAPARIPPVEATKNEEIVYGS
jgi:AcrR family transcriptional regulator